MEGWVVNMARNDVQLDFHLTSLTGEEAKISEKIGMLLLASDFIGSARINRAPKLERISKANINFLLSQTKSGDYLAINPFSARPLKVKLTQLPSRKSITEFTSDSSNLNLNKLLKKLRSFETKEAEILGAFNPKEMKIIEKLLQAPRSERKDFQILQSTRDQSTINDDLNAVNQLLYDDKSLTKEIKDRLDIVDKALAEEVKKVDQTYKEREKYWKSEIENKNELLQKRLKQREGELDKQIQVYEKEVNKKIANNLAKFKEGVAKNVRRDEKPIEKSIQNLEKLVSQSPSRDMVESIEKELVKLSEMTKIFSEAVGFAIRQVDIVKGKEDDILEIQDLEVNKLKEQSEVDKQNLREESKRKEKERDVEMRQLKESRDNVNKYYAEFKDLRDDWMNQIKEEIGKQETAMVPQRLIPVNASGNAPKTLLLQVPTYIFQYKKENEHFTIAIPPVQMPDSMRKPLKGAFFGEHRTVFYNFVIPETEKIITEWFFDASKHLDLQSNIQNLTNLLDNPADLRDTFFNNRTLMVDKLKVNNANFKKANDRLTEVFTTG